MIYRGLALAGILTLASCSAWDIINPFKSGKGLSVDTEIVAGDKHEEIASGAVVGTNETTTNTADEIHQVISTVNEANPIIPWIVAMLFLMLPTPTRMWIGIKGLLRRKK